MLAGDTAGPQPQPAGPAPGVGTPAPELLRLLRGWGVGLSPVAPDAAAQRLADSMGWMDAVALAQTLGATEPVSAPASATASAPDAALLQAAQATAHAVVARCRAALLASFTDPALLRGGTPPGSSALEAVAPFRQHHVQQQRAMAARLPPLRALLREQISAASPRLAQLAALDAVLESALHDIQQQRLAALPSMLQQRGLGLKPADQHGPEAWPPQGWRAQLWADLQRLLQAELALRWQPLQGLADALQDDIDAALAAAQPLQPDPRLFA